MQSHCHILHTIFAVLTAPSISPVRCLNECRRNPRKAIPDCRQRLPALKAPSCPLLEGRNQWHCTGTGNHHKNGNSLYLFRSVAGGGKGAGFQCCFGRALTSGQNETGKSKHYKNLFYHNHTAFHFVLDAFTKGKTGQEFTTLYLFVLYHNHSPDTFIFSYKTIKSDKFTVFSFLP